MNLNSAWICEWEWNNVERFAHLDWLEQKLMKNVPVVTNASFPLSCVLLTHNNGSTSTYLSLSLNVKYRQIRDKSVLIIRSGMEECFVILCR